MDLHRKPDVTIPDGAPPAELVIDDLVVGDGMEATAGMQVTVDYVGVSWSTKAEFDASWNRNDTFSFDSVLARSSRVGTRASRG